MPCDGHRLLETPRRLSESGLWALNERFYSEIGPDAWDQVPEHVSTGAWSARVQADLALAFLQDLAADGLLSAEVTVTVLEVGCGTGRFAYRFYRALSELLATSRLTHIAVSWVFTDLVGANLDVARNHEQFVPAVESGRVAFVPWDVTSTEPPVEVTGPIIVLANYMFDSVPSDAYLSCEDGLRSLLMGMSAPLTVDSTHARLIDHLSAHWHLDPS